MNVRLLLTFPFFRPSLVVLLAMHCLLALLILHVRLPSSNGQDKPHGGEGSNYKGPVRIAKLLWKSNPENAASTLRNALDTALERQELAGLQQAAELIREQAVGVVELGDSKDPRYAASWAIAVISSWEVASQARLEQLIPQFELLTDRELLWRVCLQGDSAEALAAMDTMLIQALMAEDADWIQLLIKHAIAADPGGATERILARWHELPSAVQVSVIEPMTSSVPSMTRLVAAIQSGQVSKDLLNTNQLRKWIATGNEALLAQIEAVWGKVRIDDNAARQALVTATLEMLRSGVSGSAGRGKKVFERVCSQCHQLHGKGFEVGPNITNNGRGNLDQLVSNVLDPSLVIGEAFQAKLILTTDGEVLSGLKVAETDRYVKIKLQGGKVVELEKETDIEQIKESEKSLMPEGLEEQLSQQEMVDLFAYLSLLKPLGEEDNELIPATPANLVTP